MNPYNFSVLFFAFNSFTVGLIVWLKQQNKLSQVFLIFSLFTALWGIMFAVMVSPNVSDSAALLAARFCNVGGMNTALFWYYFVLIYTGPVHRKDRFILCFFGSLSLIVLILMLTPWFIPRMKSVGVFERYPVPGPFYHLHTFTFFSLVVLGFNRLVQKWKMSQGPEKIQIGGLTLSAVVGYFGGSMAFWAVYDIAWPPYGMFVMPLYLKRLLMESSLR